ncbi:MAG: AmmeMemoRadiSam system protein B [Candidatus Bipolaricaulota bacterium]|nr:AmmeMemoRadiSam system protein B [Candidatus Bipolaricaulota bacterium]
MTERIRTAAVAGSFYPASPERLRRTVEALLVQANPPAFEGKLRGLIVPHAGYIYSGPVAATGYKLIQSLSLSSARILMLGPAHYVYFVGAATLDVDAWQTPLGLVKSSKELIAQALKNGDLLDTPDAHAPEHSLEVQLPFLQVVLPHCTIFPVLTGECDYRELARVLSSYLDELDLVIVSSDLSHYYSYDEAVQRDAVAHRAIEQLDIRLMEDHVEACGKTAILTLMQIARERGWSAKLLDYRNSGDTAGDKFRVVGYGCYAFVEG